MKRPGKPVLWSMLLLTAAVLFTMTILPGIIRNKAVSSLERATGRRATIASIKLNPFTLTAEVIGFRLTERTNDQTFAAFSSARVKISPASLRKRAFIISRAELASPYLHLVRSGANSYNFSDLLQGKQQKTGQQQTPLFSINNIAISNGSVDFHDNAGSRTTRHTVRTMQLTVPFISNIPYLAKITVAPHFSAIINGAPLTAHGKLRPLDRAAETSAIIVLRNIDLPHYLAYLPFAAQITVPSGKLSTTAEVRYTVSASAQPEISLSGSLLLKDLRMADHQREPLLSLPTGLLQVKRADLMARSFAVTSLETSGLEIYLERTKQGLWPWQSLLTAGQPSPPNSTAETSPSRFAAGLVSARNSRLHLRDQLPPGGFRTDLQISDLTLRNLSTDKGRSASFAMAVRSAWGESVATEGTATLAPVAATARVTATGLDLARYYPYLAGSLTAAVSGRLDLTGTLHHTTERGLTVEDVTLTCRDLAAPFAKDESASLNSIVLSGGSLSLKERTAGVEAITITGGTIALSRDKQGRFSPHNLLRTKPADTKKLVQPATPPFSYLVKRIDGSKLDITFTDRSRRETARLPLRDLRFALQNISGPKSTVIPFSLATAYGRTGSITVAGNITPPPLKVDGNATLQRIPLREANAYLPDNLAVTIAGGALDSRMKFQLAQTSGGMTGSFAGTLGLRSFYCLDTNENEDLLKWERLQLNGIRGTLAPFALSIGEVALSKYYSRLIINKDGKLNLQNLLTTPADGAATTTSAAKPAIKASAQAAGKPAAIKIGTVTLQGGTMVFSDRHLPLPFTTTFYNLGGRVSGLSSDKSRSATVDLRGNLENHSPLTIQGSINPLRDDLFVDLKIDFADIDLTPATAYTGTYLGYAVDKGKLFLQLQYHIENKNLDSKNKIFFDQFTFGNKVESDKATSLPVRLAVALLKDRKGEIHLDLPVTGRTDDPQFSIWRLVFKVFGNLLAKAATSPFALLQAAFGGSEDFSSVTFQPGSARLTQAEQDKLLKLAEAVLDRPGLDMEVIGYVDKDKDPEGWRRELLEKKVRTEKFLALVKDKNNKPGQTPDSIQLTPEEYSRYLKVVYRKEKFPKPRNLIGLPKDLPDPEMKKLIITNTAAGEGELQKLAAERAAVVRTFLTETGRIAQERVFLKNADIYKAPGREGQSASRVEFGAVAK